MLREPICWHSFKQFIATKLDKKIIITIIKQELQFANILFDTKVHLCGIA